MSVKTLAKSVGLGNFFTGIYTGDGGATQAVIGVGFQPIAVIIYHRVIGPPYTTDDLPGVKTDVDGAFSFCWDATNFAWRWQTDNIISLDADGFTVGDGTPLGINMCNVAARGYTYICFG